MYYKLLSFGDVIELKTQINPYKLFDEIKHFDSSWKVYNPRRENNRFGLSVTSSDGELNGIDLDSVPQYNEEYNTSYTETSFKEKTQVYYDSEEVRKIVEPFNKHLCRTHIINLKKNGSFPPHRDWLFVDRQESFRIFVPLKDCNSPSMYFMYEKELLHFEHGRAYFINTNKEHCVFSFSDDTVFMVMNIECNKDSINAVLSNMISR